MTAQEILSSARAFGESADAEGMGNLADAHRCVVANPRSKRNIGKVPVIDMMRAYADGLRTRLSAA